MDITVSDYIAYLELAASRIAGGKDYITQLDAATGDGDHWANINMGFENIIAVSGQLKEMDFSSMFRKIGMVMMNKIGGSSGILYGSAYQAAGKILPSEKQITLSDLGASLDAMLQDMMMRGKAKPGYKTMIDTLYPAVEAFKAAQASGCNNKTLLERVKKAADDGAQSTMNMEAVKGRATYQANKGVGHLDPGAVTMAWQICSLCDTLLSKLQE